MSEREGAVTAMTIASGMGMSETTALPKITDRRTSLVSTKLCETMKSTAGHDFDFSITRGQTPLLEYNSLHDPHLKHYFYRPHMVQQLIRKRCVTANLQVVCGTQKEYNLYCAFIDQEKLKTKKRKDIEIVKRKGLLTTPSGKKKLESGCQLRKTFYQHEEKKLKAREEELKKSEAKLRIDKKKALVLRYIRRELDYLRKMNEISHRKIMMLMKMHDKTQGDSRRQSHALRTELSGKLRALQLRRMDEGERIRTLTELEVLWNKHGDYACMMQEEEEKRMEREGGEDECHTREKQGALLLSYLQADMASFRRRSTISSELSAKEEQFKKQQEKVKQKSKAEKIPASNKKFPRKDVDQWKDWIQRQQNQCTVMLQQRSETWHEERRKLFELLWSEVPNEAEPFTSKVSFEFKGQARVDESMEYGNAKQKRKILLPILFGKSSAWQS